MTDLPRQGDTLDLLALAADDEIVTALASGRPVADDDLTVLLTQFRVELDEAYDAADLATAPVPAPAAARAHRWRRGAALGVATFTVAASLTGVAAAVGGNANPLHRAIVDLVDPGPDRPLQEARRLLADAEHATDAARARGWIAADERSEILASLDRVMKLSTTAHRGELVSIEHRVAAARTVLGSLPTSPPPVEDHAGSTEDRGTSGAGTRSGGEQETRSGDGTSGPAGGQDSESRSGSDSGSGSSGSGSTSGSDSGSTTERSGSTTSGESGDTSRGSTGSSDGGTSGVIGSDSGSSSGSYSGSQPGPGSGSYSGSWSGSGSSSGDGFSTEGSDGGSH